MSDGLKKIVRIAFIVIGIVMVGKFSFDWFNAHAEYVAGMDSAEQKISEYQTQILSNQKILDGAKDDMQTLAGNLHDMSSLGKDVADWQTDFSNYANFYGASQVAAREGTGVNDRIQEVQELLLSKFDEDDVYVWYDWNDRVDCIWKCVTGYSYYGDSMKVMWICQPYAADLYAVTDAITVYAYATADYDYISDHFSNLQTGITKSGAAYLYTYEQDQEVKAIDRGQLAVDRNNGLLQDEDGNYDQEILDEINGTRDEDGLDEDGNEPGVIDVQDLQDGGEPDGSDDSDDTGGDTYSGDPSDFVFD